MVCHGGATGGAHLPHWAACQWACPLVLLTRRQRWVYPCLCPCHLNILLIPSWNMMLSDSVKQDIWDPAAFKSWRVGIRARKNIKNIIFDEKFASKWCLYLSVDVMAWTLLLRGCFQLHCCFLPSDNLWPPVTGIALSRMVHVPIIGPVRLSMSTSFRFGLAANSGKGAGFVGWLLDRIGRRKTPGPSP